MKELYLVSKYYFKKLLENDYLKIDADLKDYSLNNLVDLCKIGNVINLDLLSELLINLNNYKSLNKEELFNNQFIVINFMVNNLIHFLKQNYNYELNGIMSDKYYRLRLSIIRTSLLNNNYINEDILSCIIDDYKFNNVLINEWNLLKDELLVIKDMLLEIDTDLKFGIYKNFINDLIVFIDNRIVQLHPKFIDKVMIKRIKGE